MRKIDARGRVTLPARQRKLAGIEPGDEVECFAADGQLIITKSSLDSSAVTPISEIPDYLLRTEYKGLLASITQAIGVKSVSRQALVVAIKQGLPYATVELMRTAYRITQIQTASMLGISVSTLNRRRLAGWFTPTESKRLFKLLLLHHAAVAMMMGDHQEALAWVEKPLDVLDKRTPVECIQQGHLDVLDLIGRIRYGVFS
ncbi:MAG: antitoxin Xre-like helix-turn-helix domain-containing protein [Motiliproteus sp.]